jgi:Zn-dependent peptidase ImmA (M78 family)
MLLGDKTIFALELLPLTPSWDRIYVAERTGWATFSLWVGGQNLCRNALEGTQVIREGVNVPLVPIADWIVRSWWFLRLEERPPSFPPRDSAIETLRRWGSAPAPRGTEEDSWVDSREDWWSRHFLLAGSDGAQLPNVAFVRSADALTVEWTPGQFAGARRPQFLASDGQARVSWEHAENTLSEFVACVADWIRDAEIQDVYGWAKKRDPIRQLDFRLVDALAIYTGRSTEALLEWTESRTESELRAKLGLPGNDPAGSVITQALRDLPPRFVSTIRDELFSLDARVRAGNGVDSGLRAVARDAARAGTTAEESGQLAAHEVRERLSMNGRAAPELDEFLHGIGVDVRDSGIECSNERMLVGARIGGSASVVINRTPRTDVPWGRRFELARGLGHLLLNSFRDGALGAASSSFSQPWMRRISGAFAAEFLLPTDELHARRLSELDAAADPQVFQGLMEEFGVGARTAAFQLWNRGLLSSAQIRDDLIDRFSASTR